MHTYHTPPHGDNQDLRATCIRRITKALSRAAPRHLAFTLDVGGGKVMHGLCGFTDQIQAETTGLYIALSPLGAAAAPASWAAALNNTNNATLYTYWDCSTFKSSTCTFKKP